MGRIITPTFRVEATESRGTGSLTFIASWNTKSYGRPTDANVEKWRVALNKSYLPEGCNEHISIALGVIPHVIGAVVIRQSNDEIVARSEMPTFEVIG